MHTPTEQNIFPIVLLLSKGKNSLDNPSLSLLILLGLEQEPESARDVPLSSFKHLDEWQETY